MEFNSGITTERAGMRLIMSNETNESAEFSVEDGKLVKEDSEEANFEENLTFEDE